MSGADQKSSIAQARTEITARLDEIDVGAFSPAALTAYKAKTTDYMEELFTESFKAARRQEADVISAAHVVAAADRLVSRPTSRKMQRFGMLGGVLLGVGLSQLVSMAATGQFTAVGTLLACASGIVGAFAIAFHWAKESAA